MVLVHLRSCWKGAFYVNPNLNGIHPHGQRIGTRSKKWAVLTPWIRMKIWERRFGSRSTVKLSTFWTDGRVDNCETLVLFRCIPIPIDLGTFDVFGVELKINDARFLIDLEVVISKWWTFHCLWSRMIIMDINSFCGKRLKLSMTNCCSIIIITILKISRVTLNICTVFIHRYIITKK